MTLKHLLRNTFAAAALSAAALVAIDAPQAHAMPVVIVAGYAPPPIPVYEQPVIPGEGYIWTPGYWAWGPDGYYWVEGAWVMPPYMGALWTPGWWGWGTGGYFWHAGYWGRTVGYYGGINYGFGYFGTGFYGGYWNGGHFWYNRAYGHFGPGFHGAMYERSYAGFNPHPGGASFAAHPPAQFGGGMNRGEAFNHASAINGRGAESFHQAAEANRGGFAPGPQHGFAGAPQGAGRPGYGAPAGGGGFEPRGGGNFGGGAPAGGGFHGNAGGGGGGFHGGGGGGRR